MLASTARRGAPFALALFTVLLSGACSSESDPAAPPPEEPKCPGDLESSRFAHGASPDGSPDPFGAKAAGQARAGRVRDASQIVQAANARHKVRPGDLVIANDKLAAYIEDVGVSDGYNPFGGDVLSIDPVGDDGRPLGISQYGESILALSRQVVAPERVTVLADGTDGKAAIVRVSGQLKNIPFLDTFKPIFPQEFDFPAALDYVLEPGAEKLTLRLSLTNTRLEAVDFKGSQNFGFFHSARSQPFTEVDGYALPPTGKTDLAAFDADVSAFGLRLVGGKLEPGLEISGFQIFNGPGFAIDACSSKTVDYVELYTGRSLDAVLESKRRATSEPAWREVKGTLTETGAGPIAGAHVHATSPDGKYLTRALTNDKGEFVLHVPQGPALLTPIARGWAIPAGTSVDGASASLSLPRSASLAIVARDETAKLLPARVQVLPAGGVAEPPAAFGEKTEVGGRMWQVYTDAIGSVSVPVPPGTHRVYVTRGFEYELFDTTVTAEAGKVTPVAAYLAHSVDSTGVMCADFHIHSFYSADSSDPVHDKVRSAVGDGLEIPVSSEHEYIIDFEPYVRELGLDKWAFGMPSEELTTFAWGHFGVVPIYPKDGAPNRGAVDWVGKSPDAVFGQVNALPEKPVLIVNHPRGAKFSSYFTAAELDTKTATGDNKELWSDAFGAVEVFNDSDLEKNRKDSLADWFALVNAGKPVVAVGSSDSHKIRTSPIGYPRTCIRFGHDDPRKLTPEIVRDAVKSGASVVSGGLYMTVAGPDGAGPGATSTAGAYKVTVQAPGFIDASTLEVFVDGESVSTQPLTATPGPGPGKKYEATVDVQPRQSKARHWVVFHAKGPDGKDLSPLHPGRNPFAVSNPIFF